MRGQSGAGTTPADFACQRRHSARGASLDRGAPSQTRRHKAALARSGLFPQRESRRLLFCPFVADAFQLALDGSRHAT